MVRLFEVVSPFEPAGGPARCDRAAGGRNRRGERFQTLLGITGSGKSATMAWTIEAVQRPTLILAPNKSLAAQLANEFREFFPNNRVEYFVSYYDYYQPEAYIASSDTYIEKDSSVNDEIDRLQALGDSALLTQARCDRGGFRELHLRPWDRPRSMHLGSWRSGWATRSTSARCCGVWSISSTSETT